ncbi:MAG: glycoside hydrolase family 3 protein [Actinomycetota bacterium]
MVAFQGTVVDEAVSALVADRRVAGVTLYGSLNIETATQTRLLTGDLIRAGRRPLLIGIDQEGGQLVGAGPETTAFAGNMALGAIHDADLAYRVGRAIGAELRALGINVNYAPVADVASRPGNPSLGIRSFGESPRSVAILTAAMVGGLQSAGVAATLKHFPGKGEAAVDPHYQMPVLDLDRERLEQVEFTPFRAGIDAGARLMMVGHYGLPAITGDRVTPASVAPAVLSGLIRHELGFKGVIITDALDMGGFGSYPTERPLEAGADLLLFGPAQAGNLPDWKGPGPSSFEDLLAWLESFPQPGLATVGSAQHRRLAEELARRSITLVKDDAALLPLRLSVDQRLLAVMPRPIDLTPADTSSLVKPGLAAALRQRHPATTEIVVDHRPSTTQISAVRAASDHHDLTVIGTIDAGEEQGHLVSTLVGSGKPVVAVALRTPYDLLQYPAAPTYVCTYGIHPPSMEALAAALFGWEEVSGRLPVSIPQAYPSGHGLSQKAAR